MCEISCVKILLPPHDEEKGPVANPTSHTEKAGAKKKKIFATISVYVATGVLIPGFSSKIGNAIDYAPLNTKPATIVPIPYMNRDKDNTLITLYVFSERSHVSLVSDK